MRFDPTEMRGSEVYRLMTDVIVPRPIAFVSTVDAAGALNLAPFSFFTGISSRPPLLAICVGDKSVPGSDGQPVLVPKDTAANILETGELVVNVVTEPIAEPMNSTAAEFPHGMSEFDIAGLTPVASERVKPPRVAESPVNLECRLYKQVDLGEARIHMLVCEILLAHVDDTLVDENGRIGVEVLKPVGRLGKSGYTAAGRIFDLARPKYPKD
jgi:flavin reductase (DIM6/NTAB) family NADH-FMN oxidoreductase RutF